MNHYPLRGLPPELRRQMERDAQARDVPFLEVIRQTLCEHYGLDCEPTAGWMRQDTWTGAENVDLRMPSELYAAIKNDAAESGETMRALILDALESHYAEEATA